MVPNDRAPQHTTAEYLLAFRRELVLGGVLDSIADEMVMHAAKVLISEGGLGVNFPTESSDG